MTITPVKNPYLAGNFAPIPEETTAVDLPVTGRLPEALDGRLLRIGPNPVTPVDPATHHWFLGTGMAHGVRLRGGRAEWYRSRYVRSDSVTAALGGPATPGPRHGMGDGTANTNIVEHAGQTLAIVEAGALPVVLTADLETVTRTDFGGTLPGSFTAHPKRDPDTGELHAVVYFWEWDHIQYVVVGTDGRVRHTVDVPVPGKPMVHDCAITESSVLLFDLPCHFDLELAMHGTAFPYRWTDAFAARVGVLPRSGTAADVRWCELDEPCYVFHPLNAYDVDDGTVVVDVVRWPTMFAVDPRGPSDGPTRLERWVCDPVRGRVRSEVLSDVSQEFPRHDERLIGRRHRFGYGAAFAAGADGVQMGSLLKHDVDARTTEVHDVGAHRSAMEPVFVPRGADAAEDDGWVLAYVHDAERNACDVVVLDAQDFGGEPVATVHLPVRVPFGFHGNWVPASA
ncbi:MAG: carotenoid oxygenase family protein [Actinomycetota bacterium]